MAQKDSESLEFSILISTLVVGGAGGAGGEGDVHDSAAPPPAGQREKLSLLGLSVMCPMLASLSASSGLNHGKPGSGG